MRVGNVKAGPFGPLMIRKRLKEPNKDSKSLIKSKKKFRKFHNQKDLPDQ